MYIFGWMIVISFGTVLLMDIHFLLFLSYNFWKNVLVDLQRYSAGHKISSKSLYRARFSTDTWFSDLFLCLPYLQNS